MTSGIDDTEIRELKDVLKRINGAINKCAEKITTAKWNMNVLIEEDLLSSRMPLDLQKIRYPYYYQDDDKKWHVWLSDKETIVVLKHPCFAPEIINRHEEFGFTKSGFRKKLQHCHVSKAWHDLVNRVEPSGLIYYIYKKLTGEECPYSIICQNCGHVIVCDKKTHIGCSKYLLNQLERHEQSCPLNLGHGKELLINGQLYKISGDRLTFGNVVCGEADDHVCFINALEFENLDKYRKKPHQYYHVKTDDVNIYVRKKCVTGFNLVKEPPIMANQLEDKMKSYVEEFKNLLKDAVVKIEHDVKHEMEKCDDRLKATEKDLNAVVVDLASDVKLLKERLKQTIDENEVHLARTRADIFKAVADMELKMNDVACDDYEVDDELPTGSPVKVTILDPKPQRVKRSKVEVVQSSDNERKPDREQLFLANAAGQHDRIVQDCNCPRCACTFGCTCDLCSGNACVWCNEIGHSTRSCDHAKKRACKKCGVFQQNWYTKCIYDPTRSKYGTDTLCCVKEEKCIVCDTVGHCALACPVVRHSTFCKDPSVVNYHGLNNTILDTMLLPPQDWVRVVEGKRQMKVERKKERRERKRSDPQ